MDILLLPDKPTNIIGKVGDTVQFAVALKDSAGTTINLTGYTAKFQVRKTKSAATPDVSLTHSSGIAITPSTGELVVTVPAATTLSMADATLKTYSGFHELEITSAGGIVQTILEGTFSLTEQVAV